MQAMRIPTVLLLSFLDRWKELKESSEGFAWFVNVLKIPIIILITVQLIVMGILYYMKRKDLLYTAIATNLILFSVIFLTIIYMMYF